MRSIICGVHGADHERCWKVGGAEGDVQRFDNSVDNAFDRGVQDVVDAPDDVAHFAGDQVRLRRHPLLK